MNNPKDIEEIFEPAGAETDPPGGNGGGGHNARSLFGDPPGGNGGGGRLFEPERASVEQAIDDKSSDSEIA